MREDQQPSHLLHEPIHRAHFSGDDDVDDGDDDGNDGDDGDDGGDGNDGNDGDYQSIC